MLGDSQSALESFSRAIAALPADDDDRFWLTALRIATTLTDLRDWLRAEARLHDLIALATDEERVRVVSVRLAQLEISRGNLEQAEYLLRVARGSSWSPAEPEELLSYARLFLAREDWTRAADYLRRVLAQQPSPVVHRMLGELLLERLRDVPAAMLEFQRALDQGSLEPRLLVRALAAALYADDSRRLERLTELIHQTQQPTAAAQLIRRGYLYTAQLLRQHGIPDASLESQFTAADLANSLLTPPLVASSAMGALSVEETLAPYPSPGTLQLLESPDGSLSYDLYLSFGESQYEWHFRAWLRLVSIVVGSKTGRELRRDTIHLCVCRGCLANIGTQRALGSSFSCISCGLPVAVRDESSPRLAALYERLQSLLAWRENDVIRCDIFVLLAIQPDRLLNPQEELSLEQLLRERGLDLVPPTRWCCPRPNPRRGKRQLRCRSSSVLRCVAATGVRSALFRPDAV